MSQTQVLALPGIPESTKKLSPKEKFKKNSTRLCAHARFINNSCGEIVESYKVDIGVKLVVGMTPDALIQKFIDATQEEWSNIGNANLDYFMENAKTLFRYFGDQLVDDVCKIVKSPKLSDRDRKRFWELLKVMVVNSIDHINPKPDSELWLLRKRIVNSLKK